MRRTAPSGYTPPIPKRLPQNKSACGMDGRQVSMAQLRQAAQKIRIQAAELPECAVMRRAAVLILFVCKDDQWNLLFTRRTDSVQHHRGQVAFPGGGFEDQDLSLEETALREAEEEIGIHRDWVEIWGKMDDMVTISNYVVTPVIGHLHHIPNQFQLSQDEVDRVFLIPINWLSDEHHWEERPLDRGNGKIEQVVFFHPYDDELVWGITARLTVNLLEKLDIKNLPDQN